MRNDQARLLAQIEKDPYIFTLQSNLIDINTTYKKLARKESLWVKQRAKKNWLTNGDDDMKFLYLSIKERRSSNLIREIHKNDEIISDPTIIGDSFCNYFSCLFNMPQPNIFSIDELPNWFTLNTNQILKLGILFCDQEIFQALKDINEDQTLGIDSLKAKFFTHGWNVIGKKFIVAVKYFSNSYNILDSFKHTLITLIPRSKNATSLVVFRTVSLCTTFYKVIAKILANRLKNTLPMIIHAAQFAFIKNRDIVDNIALAYKIFGDFN